MYRIKLSEEAKKDFDEYLHHVRAVYYAPLTAIKHYAELTKTIHSLKCFSGSYPVQTYISFLRYGSNVRRINYKKMAISYIVHSDIVYIYRIISATLITSL
ncbi:type II toxin-antitoxin system RelE/ParE family toxin [uncultured Proteiniphilum sp.]|uniref:type II toxin-antitoxin system RelE/ParE family toxin n=1 Tax=uncultured Proteiniphilum sp. TaxID=497637 RepID=UPI00344B0C4D